MQRRLYPLAQSAIVFGPEHGRNMEANRLVRYSNHSSIAFLISSSSSSARPAAHQLVVVGLVAHVQRASIILLVASGGVTAGPGRLQKSAIPSSDPYAVIVLLSSTGSRFRVCNSFFLFFSCSCVSVCAIVCASRPFCLSSFGPVRAVPVMARGLVSGTDGLICLSCSSWITDDWGVTILPARVNRFLCEALVGRG